MRKVVCLFLAGCGGGAIHETQTAHTMRVVAVEPMDQPAPARLPVQVAGSAQREGNLLRVDVRALAKGHSSGEALEVPTNWTVEAQGADGQPLKRLVVGPARVERDPAGKTGDAWDVNVNFTVYFQPPKQATHVDVRLISPDANEAKISADLPSAR